MSILKYLRPVIVSRSRWRKCPVALVLDCGGIKGLGRLSLQLLPLRRRLLRLNLGVPKSVKPKKNHIACAPCRVCPDNMLKYIYTEPLTDMVISSSSYAVLSAHRRLKCLCLLLPVVAPPLGWRSTSPCPPGASRPSGVRALSNRDSERVQVFIGNQREQLQREPAQAPSGHIKPKRCHAVGFERV